MKFNPKNLLSNSFLVFLSLGVSFLFIEELILKYILPTTDVPRVSHSKKMTRYKPNQKGVFRLANEYSAPFSINRNGWNSHHEEYSINKNQKLRIAIVGDSYVAALEPGYKFAIPYLIEKSLGSNIAEVYAFGIGGAHLAQYLHMYKEEVTKFNPDIVIFLVIHNDFAPSYRNDLTASGRYGGTFLTFSLLPDHSVKTVPTKPYDKRWDLLLDFRSIRFSFYQYKLRTKINYIKNLALKKQYKMNVDTVSLENSFNDDKVIAKYVVEEIASIAKRRNTKLVFAMNGDTQSIYEKIPSNDLNTALRLNKMMEEVVIKSGGKFIDLHKTFENDFNSHNKKFEFKTDGHWNPYGQKIAAEPILKIIQQMQKNS